MNTIQFNKNHGGPLHYLGNRFLSLPDNSGHMSRDNSWLKEHFSLIKYNLQSKKYKRCIEPFSGSASWSIAAMELGLALQYVINDSDKILIGALKLIKDKPELIKTSYAFLERAFEKALSKKACFLKTLDTYNSSKVDEEKALLLPFIINHSWSGILFHNSNGEILYREGPLFEGKSSERFLEKANLSIDEFNAEVDRVSQLFNENDVEFRSGDFLDALIDIQPGDFIALNPPYPENERSVTEKSGMYVELYSPEKLHENLRQLIDHMEEQGVHYYMTYGFYNPSLHQYVLRDDTHQPKNYFRVLGYETCAFGVGLDQIYFTPEFSIPEQLNTKVVLAAKVLEGNTPLPTPDEALRQYDIFLHS
ncbi:MAG: DNA adenine methylase [Legionella sp.]|nr:DNA adenine methylase [Legionella sp.]